MHKINIFLIILVLLCIAHFSSSAIDIVKTNKSEIELCLLIAPAYNFYYPSLVNGFYFESMEIGLQGNYDNRIKFVINFDFSELDNEDESFSPEFIQNVYLQYKFYKQFKIRVGQFKVPLGDEISLGISERPYFDHSLGSRKLAPGRHLGFMIFGKDLFSLFGYRIGIFNTSEVSFSENETPFISTAGKFFFEFDNFKRISLKSGYSIYYSFEEIFTQSVFLSFNCQIDDIRKFVLFGEYMEKRFFHYILRILREPSIIFYHTQPLLICF